ncbi:FtsX-like permease family protein [Rhodanobacter glycinis]|uniref:FtsX-like permease family protein n=1 Tax=Rhodanobacter glycinis TaxID=582702 RepID=A0A5B9E0Q0_9GAMM|nr:ADOP family duplicated permease [Rhodanobacter glycinis]QEE25923.1 FtsX-like permease family protein [Rhodanobacter glycinis]
MIVREFRQAWRRLLRRPGYALLSVGVLGVGLGVTIFLFTMVNSLVLQPLPFPDAGRLVTIGQPESNTIGGVDSDQYLAFKGNLHSVDAMGAYDGPIGINLDSGAGAVRYRGVRMTASLMTLLGAKPLLGRGISTADDAGGAPPVVVLTEAVWRHAFRADQHIVGRSVRVNGEWATVVGVLPDSFNFPGGNQVWLPLHLSAGEHRYIGVVGRLAPSIQLSGARAELDAWAGRLQRALPAGMQTMPLVVGPMAAGFVPRDMLRWVWLMFGAGILVLLLACIHVANLQLVRTLQRRHEMALRSSLGGSRARLMLGALAESVWMAAAALALAFPLAHGCGYWIHVTWTATHPEQTLFLHGMGGAVIVFGVVIALLSTALAGGIPAWRVSRVDLQDALRDGSKGSDGGFARVARVMVVAEVALTVVLLVGAGTFVRAVDTLLAQPDVGAVHATHVLIANVALPPALYRNDAQRIRFFNDVVERLRSDAGVIAASATNTVPSAVLGSHEDVSLPGRAQPASGWPRAQMAIVDSQFLDTFGVRLLKGRFFDARDNAGNQRVAVIDGKTAAMFWPHQDPLNRILVLYPGKKYAKTVTVVGVVEQLQLDGMLERSLPGLLIPLRQAASYSPLHSVGLAVRTHMQAGSFGQQLVSVVHAVEPQAAVFNVETQARDMAQARLGLTVLTDVFSGLGLIALLLAATGLYGVLAFSVEQRTREIGIRRAIGAGSSAIVVQVGHRLFWQLGIGLAIGLVLAWPLSGVLANPGLHTRAHDPAVFILVLAMVILVAVFAALVPLLRALRVDPAVALRYE